VEEAPAGLVHLSQLGFSEDRCTNNTCGKSCSLMHYVQPFSEPLFEASFS